VKSRPQVDSLVTSTVKSADGWIATIDGWAVKVIMAAIALTALLSSAIIFVLGCCCIGSCCRRKTREAFPHAHSSAHHPTIARIASLPSAKNPGHLPYWIVLRNLRFLALASAFVFTKCIVTRSHIISPSQTLSSVACMLLACDSRARDIC
jgi:hypothetical protein